VATAARVLGVDTALRCSGYGIVERHGTELRALDHGTIRNPSNRPIGEALRVLHEEVLQLVQLQHPTAVAIEGIFHCRNVKTAVRLGEARGAVISACAASGLPIYEYAPRRVKQAVVGHGGADKTQVQAMVIRMLHPDGKPSADAADALAVAVCHLQAISVHADLAPQPLGPLPLTSDDHLPRRQT
jgi:crossover junction endodeoxyribonuclease RuvC